MHYSIFNVPICFSVVVLLLLFLHAYIYTHEAPQFNPFAAMLAALSLGKWPTQVPILKPLKLFYPFAWAPKRTFIKIHSIDSGFVTGPSNILSAGAYVCIFEPGNFTGWGSEGVKVSSGLVQSPASGFNGWLYGLCRCDFVQHSCWQSKLRGTEVASHWQAPHFPSIYSVFTGRSALGRATHRYRSQLFLFLVDRMTNCGICGR